MMNAGCSNNVWRDRSSSDCRKLEIKWYSRMENRLWQSVPRTRTSDREGSVTDGWETCTADRDVDEAEQRRCRASEFADRCSSPAKYSGAVRCRHLYTRIASSNSIRSRSGAFRQRSWRSSGVTWSNLDVANTSLSVEFITDCSRLTRWCGMQYGVPLP